VYQINILDFEKGVLVFTFVGYENQEVIVKSRSEINIALKINPTQLDEVVVVSALGITRKQKSVTYASQTVDPTTLTEARDLNFLNGLTGKVAGLQVTGSGQPGSSVRLTLRGDNSFSGNNQPLMVIDGVPVENPIGTSGNLDYGNPISNNMYNSLPSNYANQYYNQFVSAANKGYGSGLGSDNTYDSSMSMPKNELIEKLNYIIDLLEEQQDYKTNSILEDLILYAFLGIFIIFIVDSFSKSNKYL
jgi:hypothetical protein